MSSVNYFNKTAGWNLQHTYGKLPSGFFTYQQPVPVKNPKTVILNEDLCKELGLDFSDFPPQEIALLFSGNKTPQGSQPLAQAYAGHQFGNLTMLGDGRAILIGEQKSPNGSLVDMQLKGSGRTPYSRGGDGRATLKSMLREYLISESMFHLGIPTTRSLAVIESGETVYREKSQTGAILTRTAQSHIRVGTFEYARHFLTLEEQKELTNYTIGRHYTMLIGEENPALALLKAVMEKQAALVVDWMRVGFIHGVMNTDNMSIAGETIDYGPCAFMNTYNPKTVFSSIDVNGRYAYGNQPYITHWNLSILAGALLPQIHADQKQAIELAQETLNAFQEIYEEKWLTMMRGKLGLIEKEASDKHIIEDLLALMQQFGADYTNTFVALQTGDLSGEAFYEASAFQEWYLHWVKQVTRNGRNLEEVQKSMAQYNPYFIPRNHLVEEALDNASLNNDYQLFKELDQLLKTPYNPDSTKLHFQSPPPNGDAGYRTFCGT
ncbi:YdiU family protein [Aquiflexum sp.]|uniref:protein adenylyltransferase SelO n=1 Tax=Aquiflexum sp. TaxID=1872584 RepID=UPI0035946A44